MITKHSATTGYGWKKAIGIGLVGVSAVLIGVIMFADRASMPVATASLGLPAGIGTLVADLASALGFGEGVTPMQSSPLGIEAPQGVNLREFPAGFTDYIRPSSITPVVHTQSASLGIDAPQGVSLRDFPTGFTDYIRPSSIMPALHTQSSQLGIDAPQGVDLREMPAGFTDYIRPSSITPVVRTQSAPLGIEAPQGVNLRDLPTGLTDYVRHDN